jgi:hypothetical protein
LSKRRKLELNLFWLTRFHHFFFTDVSLCLFVKGREE